MIHRVVGFGGLRALDVVYGGDHFGIVVSLGLGLRNLMRAMHVCIYVYCIYHFLWKEGRHILINHFVPKYHP